MPSTFETIDAACMKFRLEHLAPSGGWLASLIIPLAQMTGVWDFTWLFFITLWSCMFFRRTTCEMAVLFGALYDISIPGCHWMQGVHPKECAAYWPKRMIAFAIEMVFYIILDADMFNWYIAANTIVMMYMWMSPKYQWPIVYPDNKDSSKSARQDASQPAGDDSKPDPLVTPEYRKYLKDKCDAMIGKQAEEKKSKYKKSLDELQQNVRLPMKSSRYKKALENLAKMKIRTPEQWHAGNKGSGSGSSGGSGASGSGGEQGGSGTGTDNSSLQLPDLSSLPAPPLGYAHKACVANNIDPNGMLSKEKYAECEKLIGSLTYKNKKPMPSTEKNAWKRGMREPFGSDTFQHYARQLKRLYKLKDLPIAPHHPEPGEIDDIINQAKAKGVPEEVLTGMRAGLEAGPESDAQKWHALVQTCVIELGLHCPEWLAAPDQPFIIGYKIPWDTQLKIMPLIKEKISDKTKVRGYINRLNDYFKGHGEFDTFLADLNSKIGMELKRDAIAVKSRYYPHRFNTDTGQILISSSHFFEGQWRAGFGDDKGDGAQALYTEISQYHFWSQQGKAGEKMTGAHQRGIFALCHHGIWNCRLEAYTDYIGGSLGLAMPYLRGLREKWLTSSGWQFDLVDEMLYQVKNASTKEESDAFVKRVDAALNGTSENAAADLEYMRKVHTAEEAEMRFSRDKAKILGDGFSPSGHGMATSRFIPNPEYP